MKNIFLILIIAAFLFCGKTTFSQTKVPKIVSDIVPTGIKDGDNWEKYNSNGGGFEIFLPSRPARDAEPIDIPVLGRRELVLYSSTTENMVFAVGFIDIKVPINDSEILRDLYDGWRDGVKEELPGGTLIEKDGAVEGKLSREIVYTTDLLKAHGKTFYIKGKMYQMMAMYPRAIEKDLSAAEITRITDKFFNSFRLIGSSNETKEEVDSQIVGDGLYRDEYFKFSVNLPKGWYVMNSEDLQMLREGSREQVKVYSRNTQKAIDKSTSRTTILFSLTKDKIGAANNTSLIGGAEVDINGKFDLMLIAQATEKNFSRNMNYKITSKAKWTKLGAEKAIVIEMQKTIPEIGVFKQKLYIVRTKGYLLEFAITYENEEDMKAAQEALNTFKFIK